MEAAPSCAQQINSGRNVEEKPRESGSSQCRQQILVIASNINIKRKKHVTHYSNGKTLLRIWSSLGSSETAASNYNLKALTWWYTATSNFSLKPTPHTSYAIMRGKRLSGNWFFSQAPFFHARKIRIWFCSRVAVAGWQKHTRTVPIPQPHQLCPTQQYGAFGWCCGEAIWAPLEKLGDLEPEEHANTNAPSILIDV